MRKIILTLTAIFLCTVTFAHTINWHVDGTLYQTTTCESGDTITPPTPPYKHGYHFVRWVLPFRPIEYLESTGSQAIDTGVIFSHTNSKVIIKFQPTAYENSCLSGAEKEVAGSRPWTFIATLKNSETCIWHAQSTIQNSFCTPINTSNTYVLEMSQTDDVFTKTINGLSYSRNNIPYYTFNSFALFADNYGGGNYTQRAKARIYYTKIYDNDVLVRDFIPVLDEDGTPCLYDKVERKFYYNAGTGDFIAGPVLTE